jgi:hypothetical protein
MTSTRITYTPLSSTTPEGEVSALATVYAYLLRNRKAAEPAPESDSCDDAAIVRNTEGVSHVDHQRSHAQRHSSRKIPASADTSSPQKGLIRPRGSTVSQKGAIMVPIRKTKAEEMFGPDPSLDLPQGAHLKVRALSSLHPNSTRRPVWKVTI